MRVLYLDIFAGISGDMCLAALLDLGVSERVLLRELPRIHLHNYSIETRRGLQQGVPGPKFEVRISKARAIGHAHGKYGRHRHSSPEHRAFADIKRLISESSLDRTIKARSISIFNRIALAEGKIHGIPAQRVHFHEIGAVD